MNPERNLPKFTDALTIDFLQASYTEHQKLAEEMALSEIHSLELAMPKFNTLASLNKAEFNKFMIQLVRKYKDKKIFIILATAAIDTFTCMIRDSKFYETTAGDNKSGLELLMSLLRAIKLLVLNCKVFEDPQLPYLIGFFEKSAERIRSEVEFYDGMQVIIKDIKLFMQMQLDKENRKSINNNVECQAHIVLKDSADCLLKKDKQICKNPNTGSKLLLGEVNSPKLEAGIKQSPSNSISSINPKSQNAFDIMMLSSKSLQKKRKRNF